MTNPITFKTRPSLLALVLLAVLQSWPLSAPAATTDLPAGAEVMMKAPEVDSGLQAHIVDGRKLVVAPGRCWINDKPIDVKTPVELAVPACPPLEVKDEPCVIEDAASTKPIWDRALEKSLAGGKGRFPMPGILIGTSVKVKAPRTGAGARPAGAPYKVGVDYEIDPKYAIVTRNPAGAIKAGQTVLVDYQLKTERINTLVLTPGGELRLIAGEPSQFAPEPPPVPAGSLLLANVLSRSGQASSSWDILPIAGAGSLPLPPVRRDLNRKALAKTLAKLAAGQPVKIAFWGDSVTCGGFASQPERAFPGLLVSRLSQRTPDSRITVVKACVDATNTSMRLPNFQSEVLSSHPDLIVVEFVNDLLLPEPVLQANYAAFIKQARDAGAEIILCAPHLPHPRHLKLNNWHQVATTPAYRLIRAICERDPVALADVASRWERAQREGLTPELLLKDRILHPNDRGHAVYAEEILKCFD